MSSGRWLAAVTVAVLATGAGFAGARAQTQSPERSPCRASGSVTVWPKLACPYDVLDLELTVRISCPGGEAAPGVRWLRVQHALPRGVRAVPAEGDGAGADLALDRIFLLPARQLSLSHSVQTTSPGLQTLAGARVILEDDEGRTATADLEPAVLVVSPWCRRNPSLFLPLLHRPSCVPQAEPADVALVVDRSSSVGDAGLAAATNHVHGFLDALDLTRDRIALIAFDQHALVLAPLGSSQSEVERAMANVDAAPGTRLERAIQTGVGELTGPRARPGRRRIIVLITDGVQVGPGDDGVVLAAADAARAQGVAILSLALGPHPNQELLEAIGGTPERTVPATSAGDLAGAWRTLADVAGCAK